MDRREFAVQYEALAARLWLIAASIVGDRTTADDLVQEAAVVAFRKLDEFQDGTDFGAWSARIVRHCASNYRRKTLGRNTTPIDPVSLDQHAEEANAQPFNSLAELSEFQTEFDDTMLRGLTQLTSEARACLLLRVVDGLPYSEIAELMEIPAGTAMSHVHRSKQQLRRGFGDDVLRKAVPND